jgi:uncharacterized protein (DUF2141 family)
LPPRVIGASLLVLLALVSPAATQGPETATLTVRVAGARKAQGKMAISVYQQAAGFPDTPARALRREVVAIDATALKAETVFRDLAPGVYAVAVLHDENANGKMDKNFLGIPKEGHGASNNPAPARRAPTFEEAKFTLSAPAQTVDVKLIY